MWVRVCACVSVLVCVCECGVCLSVCLCLCVCSICSLTASDHTPTQSTNGQWGGCRVISATLRPGNNPCLNLVLGSQFMPWDGSF